MVGDKRLPINRIGGFQGEDNEGYTAGWDHDTYRRTDLLPLPDCDTNVTSGCADSGRFGSSHTGGVNGLMADGSGRFLPYTIAATTSLWRGTRRAGQATPNSYPAARPRLPAGEGRQPASPPLPARLHPSPFRGIAR